MRPITQPQRRILGVTLAAIVGFGLFPPWVATSQWKAVLDGKLVIVSETHVYKGHHSLYEPPSDEVHRAEDGMSVQAVTHRIDFERLGILYGLIVLAAAGFLALSQTRRP